MNRHLLLLALVCLSPTVASGQAIDAFPRTTTIVETDLMITQINSAGAAGQKFTRGITWSNVLQSLSAFPNWPSGVTGVEAYATNYNALLTAYTNIIRVNWTNDALSSGLHLTNMATMVASAGTRVVVGPGTFWIGTNVQSLIKPGVSLHLEDSIITMGTTADSDTRFLFDDSFDGLGARDFIITGTGSFYITNSSGGLLKHTGSSRTWIDYRVAHTLGALSLLSIDYGELYVRQMEYGRSDIYDFIDTFRPSKIGIYGGKVYGGDSIFEFAKGFTNWGDCVIQVAYGECVTNATPVNTQGITLGENVLIDGGFWNLNFNGVICSGLTNENGSGAGAIIQNAYIRSAPDNTKSTIQRVSVNHGTALTIRNSTIEGPTAVDPINLTTMSGVFTLENTRVISGASATNSIRSTAEGSRLRLIGANTLDKPIASNVTLLDSTNTLSSVSVKGITSLDGALNVGGATKLTNNLSVNGTMDVGGAVNFTNTSDFFADMIVHSPGTFQTDAGVTALLQGELLTTAGVNLGNLTASRALILNANNDATNSPVTATELGYLSGTTASIPTSLSNNVRVAQGSGITVTPSGSGGVMTYTVAATGGSASTNNPASAIGALTLTNSTSQVTTNTGTNSVQGIDLMGPSFAVSRLYGPTTLVYTNVGTFTNITSMSRLFRTRVEAVTANSTLTVAIRDPIDWSGGEFVISTPPGTNDLVLEFYKGSSGNTYWKGWTDVVGTNVIHSLTSGTGTNASIMVLNHATAALEKRTIASIASSASSTPITSMFGYGQWTYAIQSVYWPWISGGSSLSSTFDKSCSVNPANAILTNVWCQFYNSSATAAVAGGTNLVMTLFTNAVSTGFSVQILGNASMTLTNSGTQAVYVPGGTRCAWQITSNTNTTQNINHSWHGQLLLQ